MKLKAIILFVAVFMLSAIVKAEVIVYRTYQDFVNQKGEHYDGYKRVGNAATFLNLLLIKDGKTEKVSCKEIWGFQFKDALFRIDRDNNPNVPYRVISINKIVYYENGLAHLEMLRENTSSGDGEWGSLWMLSKDLNSEFLGASKKDLKQLYAQNPDYEKIFDCIGKDWELDNVRSCIGEYNRE